MKNIINIENSINCLFENGILIIAAFDDEAEYNGFEGWQETLVIEDETCFVHGVNMGCYGNTYAPESGVVFDPEAQTLSVWQSRYVGQFGFCEEKITSNLYKVDFKNQTFIEL